MRRITTLLLSSLFLFLSMPEKAHAWDPTGGQPWQNRVGPGLMLGIGGNTCTEDLCEDTFEVSFGGSIGGTFGFFYRLIPNLALFADMHFGYINSSVDFVDDDHGFLFQMVFGAEGHLPIVSWLDVYLGLGVGYAYLAGWADGPIEHVSLKGVDFEMKTGIDFYPFQSIPTLGGGLLFRLGMVHWPTACRTTDLFGEEETDCDSPDDLGFDDDDLPFLIHFGMTIKYGF